MHMKMTSAEANKLIKQLRDQIRLLESQEKNLISSIAATCINLLGYEAPADYDSSVLQH